MKMLIGEKWVGKEEKIDVLNPYNNNLEHFSIYNISLWDLA